MDIQDIKLFTFYSMHSGVIFLIKCYPNKMSPYAAEWDGFQIRGDKSISQFHRYGINGLQTYSENIKVFSETKKKIVQFIFQELDATLLQ